MNGLTCFLGALPLFIIGIAAAEPLDDLQHRFTNLPMESRRLTGPLFWLHGDESPQRLEMYVEKVAEGGNGCFTAESRPHEDWLGEGWYRDLAICLEAGKKHNLRMWIFDEKWWPSGEVGGKVPQQYGSKYMEAAAVEVTGPKRLTQAAPTDKHIATLAGRMTDAGIDGGSLVDLGGSIRDGVLTWDVPEGTWTIMHFTWRYSKGRQGNLLVDGASREAVDWYIQTVFQPHYDRFKEDFGTWISGFFYDEPETYGDWGTEVIPLLNERGVDWKKALTSWKFSLAGNEQTAAKYQYQDAFAEAWGRTLFGGITRWCNAHGVQSIGHHLEHSLGYLNRNWCAGNLFQLQKYSDMGGIDAVFDQFVMGKRTARDKPTWQTPKLGSSISHVYGKADDIAMVEIFGARGQNLTYPEMKWWTNHMHVSGVNFHIPHSFNPKAPYDMDCPPYFYNGGEEPRWPLYRVYADYTTRLSTLLSGGRHVCPVALLFVGNSYHVGKAIPPEQLSEALQDALYDCDWMPYEVFEKDTAIDAQRLALHGERYRVLIVPPVEAIPYGTLAKAKAFFDGGGVVAGYGFLPSKPTELGRTAQEIQEVRQAIWGDAQPGLNVCKTNAKGGRSYLLPEAPTAEQLQQVLGGDANITPTLEVVEGKTDGWLHVLHRVKDGRNVFLICNQNVEDGARSFRLRIAAKGFPECWDAMRGDVTAVPFVRNGDSVELTLTLESCESVLLVFADALRKLPRRIEGGLEPTGKLNVAKIETALPDTSTGDDALPDPDPLDGGVWIWYPGENATVSALPGTRCFRKHFELPAARKIASAQFVGTADNVMSLFLNGDAIEERQPAFADFRRVAKVDIAASLRPGRNTAAIAVVNITDQPNPAGLIGRIDVVFEDGTMQTVPIDATWKAANRPQDGWTAPGFDDSKWVSAAAAAPYGAAPWGTLAGRQITASPVKKADPFEGTFELPADTDRKAVRVVLRAGKMTPEAAMRITVNGAYAGGGIGAPLHCDITTAAKAGINTLRIEPFSPETVEVVLYPY